ncbi:hypothetical protein IB277_37130 [Ensifer sp. ENS07]|uniref:hypothetical protein n=1 Tax=Ensifer sp. ENS07 TaxID=2769274 RepID=UPI00177D054C|nr:hypothetical protein [Ensifer sp. ENS07]MBD9641909.1 hypothetical protein [Ensifer sp. ENS07]
MAIVDLIRVLESADAGSRKLDADIALFIGWRRKVESIKINAKTGLPVKRTVWIVPSSDGTGKVPPFTTSLDAAYELAKDVARDTDIGLSFADGTYTAVVGDSGYLHAGAPALALCAAAVAAKILRGGGG